MHFIVNNGLKHSQCSKGPHISTFFDLATHQIRVHSYSLSLIFYIREVYSSHILCVLKDITTTWTWS